MIRRYLPILLGFILSSMVFTLSAEGASTAIAPEEVSAPLTVREVPAVRYWKSSNDIGFPTTLLPFQRDVAKVPLRNEPKIVPILYHNIVFGRTGNIYNRDIYNFEHDLAFLKRNYLILDFQELLDIYNGKKTIASDATVITFDDGDLSIYAIVYPLLKEMDMKATFFLVPNFIGEVGYMSWDQVREMNNYRTVTGRKLFTFGSHSLTHRPLGDLSKDEILFEMTESKRILEEELGEPILTIALPFGSGAGDKRVIDAAKESGYLAVRTSQPGAVATEMINPMNIQTFNVENYSTDVFVRHMLDLTGR